MILYDQIILLFHKKTKQFCLLLKMYAEQLTSLRDILTYFGSQSTSVLQESTASELMILKRVYTAICERLQQIEIAHKQKEPPDMEVESIKGDILGDWREEVIMTSADYSKLVILSTADETKIKLPCLAQDP